MPEILPPAAVLFTTDPSRPKTMPSKYPAPKRRKISSFEFSAKCFHKIKWISPIEIALQQQKSLGCLDLAVVTSNGWWKNSIKLQLIRCLPPFCAEYLIPDDVTFHRHGILGLFFDEYRQHFERRFEVFRRVHETFIEQIYNAFEKYFFANIYFHESCTEMRMAIGRFLRTAYFLKVFHRGEKYRFTIVYQSLLLILYSYFPMDSFLAIAMLQTLCVNDSVKPYVLVLTDNNTMKYLLCRARDARFDFWGLWRQGGALTGSFNPPAVLFGSLGKQELARTLLTYGFQYAADGTVYEERCKLLATLRHKGMCIIDSLGVSRLVQKRPQSRMLLILDIFMIFVHFDDDFNVSDKISTLIQISRSLPHPYVTAKELFYALLDVLEPTFRWKLIKICQKYSSEEIYDYDYRVLKPRRLAHLSRCAVRKALAANLSLPFGIDELKLEDNLKDYLMLEC